MWYSICAFIRFHCKATNQHGVHSPFVYDFLTEGCYQKSKKLTQFAKNQYRQGPNDRASSGTYQLLCKISLYWKPRRVLVNSRVCKTLINCIGYHGEGMVLDSPFEEGFVWPKEYSNPYDLVYFNQLRDRKQSVHLFYTSMGVSHTNTVFFFSRIRACKKSFATWKDLCAHPKAKVCLDLYNHGIILLREHQEKEYFSLRV